MGMKHTGTGCMGGILPVPSLYILHSIGRKHKYSLSPVMHTATYCSLSHSINTLLKYNLSAKSNTWCIQLTTSFSKNIGANNNYIFLTCNTFVLIYCKYYMYTGTRTAISILSHVAQNCYQPRAVHPNPVSVLLSSQFRVFAVVPSLLFASF